jgi:hypothetical protein
MHSVVSDLAILVDTDAGVCRTKIDTDGCVDLLLLAVTFLVRERHPAEHLHRIK